MEELNSIAMNPEPREAISESLRPSDADVLRQHEINIRFLSRGCLVRVGCKDIPFESVANAMNAVNAYVTNPYEEQKKWREILK